MNRRDLLTSATVLGTLASAGMLPHEALAQLKLIGSGASFPFPLYATWFKAFSKESDGITIDYQAKGSGAGIQDFINRTVAFAASDAAMKDEEIAKVDGGVVLLPMTAGEIVLAYNLDGISDLKLPRAVYADMFMGKVGAWNDPRIVEANPGVTLPDTKVTVVRRSDSSGTTFVFTNHLSAISEAFAKDVGAGTNVQWPQIASIVAAPKNDGVTATIKQTPGSIGYIEWSYAKLTKSTAALLENAAGKFVAPGGEGGAKALASAEFKPGDLRGWVPNPEDPEAYPIATFTWMLFYKKQDPAQAEALRKLVEWCLTTGQTMASQLGYIPLPEAVIEKVRAEAVNIA